MTEEARPPQPPENSGENISPPSGTAEDDLEHRPQSYEEQEALEKTSGYFKDAISLARQAVDTNIETGKITAEQAAAVERRIKHFDTYIEAAQKGNFLEEISTEENTKLIPIYSTLKRLAAHVEGQKGREEEKRRLSEAIDSINKMVTNQLGDNWQLKEIRILQPFGETRIVAIGKIDKSEHYFTPKQLNALSGHTPPNIEDRDTKDSTDKTPKPEEGKNGEQNTTGAEVIKFPANSEVTIYNPSTKQQEKWKVSKTWQGKKERVYVVTDPSGKESDKLFKESTLERMQPKDDHDKDPDTDDRIEDSGEDEPPRDEEDGKGPVGRFTADGKYEILVDPEELAKEIDVPADVIRQAAEHGIPPHILVQAKENPYAAQDLRDLGIEWGTETLPSKPDKREDDILPITEDPMVRYNRTVGTQKERWVKETSDLLADDPRTVKKMLKRPGELPARLHLIPVIGRKIGRLLLARRIYSKERSERDRNHEDGMLGLGVERTRHILHYVNSHDDDVRIQRNKLRRASRHQFYGEEAAQASRRRDFAERLHRILEDSSALEEDRIHPDRIVDYDDVLKPRVEEYRKRRYRPQTREEAAAEIIVPDTAPTPTPDIRPETGTAEEE